MQTFPYRPLQLLTSNLNTVETTNLKILWENRLQRDIVSFVVFQKKNIAERIGDDDSDMWDLTDDSEISLTSMNARTQPKDVRKCIMSLRGVTIFIKFTVHFTIIDIIMPFIMPLYG